MLKAAKVFSGPGAHIGNSGMSRRRGGISLFTGTRLAERDSPVRKSHAQITDCSLRVILK